MGTSASIAAMRGGAEALRGGGTLAGRLMSFTSLARERVWSVSSRTAALGDAAQIMVVTALPERESSSKRVSFDSR